MRLSTCYKLFTDETDYATWNDAELAVDRMVAIFIPSMIWMNGIRQSLVMFVFVYLRIPSKGFLNS